MSPESALILRILAEHGARPDLRLWRNETFGGWVGKLAGRTRGGDVVLRGARMVQSGLCVGSADLIGITHEGQFIALEVKTGTGRPTPAQLSFLAVVRDLGGIGEVVRSVEDVTRILGAPPQRRAG